MKPDEAAPSPAPPPARVRVLEDRLINQIAAGEVVERPASVLKELVENALDAGASHVRLTLRGGGRDLVQVEDDGAGMGRQDAMLCVERHATSKLRSEEDLFAITTLGFRGEALPSIAAVSRFELTTRRAEDAVGTKVVIDGGRMVDVRDAGCPVGTRLAVRSLFYNLPARRKFLRTVQTELGHCREALLRELLMRPGVGVELFSDGRSLVRAPAGVDPAARAVALLGREAEVLVPVSFEDDTVVGGLRAQGLVSPPAAHRASVRGSLWLYVNGRAVRDPLLRRAVLDAFRGLVPRGRYPTVLLDVRVAIDRVDVNVHPAKTEVRFRDGRDVLRAVSTGLRQALADQGIQAHVLRPTRGMLPEGPTQPQNQASLPGLVPAAPSMVGEDAGPAPAASEAVSGAGAPAAFPAVARPPSRPSTARPLTAQTPRPASPAVERSYQSPSRPQAPRDALPADPTQLRLVGQLGQRWLVCEQGGDLVLVDQRRAHAAAIARGLEDAPQPRPLLAPVLVEVSPGCEAAVTRGRDQLAALGVDLESFGQGTLSLRALPGALATVDTAAVVVALAQAMAEGADIDSLRGVLAEAAAVSHGQRLSPYEQRGLVEGLDPGAPGISLRLEADELARRLGREPR